jgi:hypothetical protein
MRNKWRNLSVLDRADRISRGAITDADRNHFKIEDHRAQKRAMRLKELRAQA